MSFDGRGFAATLPRRPGVYRMYGTEQAAPAALLYVGKAASLRDRVGSYFQAGKQAPKVEALVNSIATFTTCRGRITVRWCLGNRLHRDGRNPSASGAATYR